ncbi:MAG: cysteine desulfurase [Ignavibacteriae bacterium]|nr:cysteine desulfurase [Ignavibacteriota bacterium]
MTPSRFSSDLLAESPVLAFDPHAARRDFPILGELVHGRPLVYLDNAASTQKPRSVIDAISDYYEHRNSNVHRGVHHLSQVATAHYEAARERVRSFLNARSAHEIVFTRGTTESINLVAHSFGRTMVGEGDEIILSTMEHHSNIVPWQMLCEEKGARLRVIPITDEGTLRVEEYEKLFTPRTKLVTIVHVSNALGTVNPVREMIRVAHDRGVPVLVDGAQSVQHFPIDVQDLDCDFFVFSGHKIYGPTGIGVLYGKEEWLDRLPPYQGGGDMILSVSFEKTVYNHLPYKFEAGTPDIAGAIGLGAAIDYLRAFDLEALVTYERDLLAYATARLSSVPGLRIIGTAPEKASVISFMLCAIHPHDIGTILDQHGIAVRAGHHCAQPTMQRLGIPATARASFSFYNTKDDVEALMRAIDRVLEVFA